MPASSSNRGLPWLTALLSGAAVLLVAADVLLTLDNRSVEAEINLRQQLITQGLRISEANSMVARVLTEAAQTHHDPALSKLLEQQGIHLRPEGAAAGSGPAKPAQGGAPAPPGQ